jgi:hypothetical protein
MYGVFLILMIIFTILTGVASDAPMDSLMFKLCPLLAILAVGCMVMTWITAFT